LNSFSIAKDLNYFIPILKQALQINPALKFIASPWTAPGWMKYENTLNGSELDGDNVLIYAEYLTKYIQGKIDLKH
jgi:glucosylceramidase